MLQIYYLQSGASSKTTWLSTLLPPPPTPHPSPPPTRPYAKLPLYLEHLRRGFLMPGKTVQSVYQSSVEFTAKDVAERRGGRTGSWACQQRRWSWLFRLPLKYYQGAVEESLTSWALGNGLSVCIYAVGVVVVVVVGGGGGGGGDCECASATENKPEKRNSG